MTHLTTSLVKLTVFLCLLSLSLFTYFHIPAFVPDGPQLLTNNSFSLGDKGWNLFPKQPNAHIAITPGSVKLQNLNETKYIKIFQELPVEGLKKDLLFSAGIATQNIIQGSKSWERGRIVLVQYDKNRKPDFSTNHNLISLDGTNNWRTVTKTFHLAPAAEIIQVSINLSNCTGTLYSNSISLHNAVPNPYFTLMKIINISSWMIFIFFLFLGYLKNTGKLTFILIIFTLLTIILGVSISGSKKIEYRSKLITTAKQFYTNITRLPGSNLTVDSPITATVHSKDSPSKVKFPDITKIAHFILFFLFGIGLSIQKQKPVAIIILDAVLFSMISETIQFFQEGRSPLVGDAFIDASGATLGITLFTLGKHFGRISKGRNSEKKGKKNPRQHG